MKPIEKFTVSELEGYAKAHGIDISGAGTKREMAAIIKENEVECIEATVMGVHACISTDVLDDFELLEWMGEINEGNGLLLPRVIKRLFGDEWERIFAELKGDATKLSVEKASRFFTEFFTKIEAKNS